MSGRGLCDGLIRHLEDFYRLWRVIVWYRNLKNEAALACVGLLRRRERERERERGERQKVWKFGQLDFNS